MHSSPIAVQLAVHSPPVAVHSPPVALPGTAHPVAMHSSPVAQGSHSHTHACSLVLGMRTVLLPGGERCRQARVLEARHSALQPLPLPLLVLCIGSERREALQAQRMLPR